ncbi:MAG: metallophosphoesterase [archaeon]
MDTKEILSFCLKNGLLIDNELLHLFSGTSDSESVKLFIEGIKKHTKKRVITKDIIYENKDNINDFFLNLPEENKQRLEKFKIKLGLSIEISKEVENVSRIVPPAKNQGNVRVSLMPVSEGKKMEVDDFVKHFRNRFAEMRNFLQERPELDDLVSINKINGNKQGVSIIGMVLNKGITKNKNIVFELEDLTGRIKVLVSQNKKEVYEKAEEVSLDSVIGIKASGNNEILFVNDIFFPELVIPERKFSPLDENALFISDIHIGSKLFFEQNFKNFINYLNNVSEPEVEKIKYLFVVGDLVAGVGVYPNQEKYLEIVDLEEQYARVAELFSRIRSDINIIVIPGNHDCVRLAEPQPILDEKYAWPLHNLRNVTLAANPSTINIGATEDFSGFDVLCYHGFSYPYYANTVQKLITSDAINSPDKIMTYLLKNRHLAPSYSSVQCSPTEKDFLLIRKAPDIFVSGHLHRSAVSYYNNILVVSNSCWERLTPIQEKYGNIPDFCKVLLLNLKTRAVKILDFEDDGHKKKMEEFHASNQLNKTSEKEQK